MSKINMDALINDNQSIYQELKEFYYTKPGVPYSYQDFETSGLREFKVIFGEMKSLEIYDQIKLSNGLIDNILKYYENSKKELLDNIIGYITLNPIIDYYCVCLKSFKALNENNNKYTNKSIDLIKILLYKGQSNEEIKLALSMLCVINFEEIEEILNVFSINNEYIFYVIKVLETRKNSNDNIFNLAKRSKGYGKAIAIQSIQPINDEIKEWLITEGLEDNLGDMECLPYTMLSLDILKYLKCGKINKSNIKSISKAFSILFSEYTIDDIKDGLNVCNEFLKMVNNFGEDIYSLYAIISMVYSIDTLILENYNIDNTYNLSQRGAKYGSIIDSANEIYKKDMWKDIILNELGNIEMDTEIIVSAIEKTKFKIKKNEFEILINRDSINPGLYKYAFDVGNRAIKKVALKVAYEKLPLVKILKGQEKINLEDLTIKQIYHICFYFIIKGINYEEFPKEYKKINLIALKAVLIETRTEAIKNLNLVKEELEEEDKFIIEKALKTEQSSNLKNSLLSLINKVNKKREYININDIEIIRHVKDVYAFSTEIAGTEYVDLAVAYDSLNEGETLYFNREKDNVYDENAIQIVTKKGYVIGYIPRHNNLILKNLMDKGKYFYGVIKKISNDYEDIIIKVYLSYKDVISEITTTLSLLSDSENRYIQ